MSGYFRVTQKQSGGGGGGATITVSYSAAYYGKTITCSDGTTTYTATTTSSGSTTFNVNAEGTWTITCNGKTTSVDVVLEYEASMTPEGSTVLPTDDIQTWLACAGITGKSYTTLAEVLADSTTLLALMSDNNAVDYLVRSKTWIGSKPLVPTLAADDGNTFSSTPYNATYPAWKAFDGDLSTSYISQATQPTFVHIGYNFGSPKSVGEVKTSLRQDLPSEFIVQGSNDGFVSDIHNLTNTIPVSASAGMVSASVDDSAQYASYRIYGRCTQTTSNYSFQVNELQFYTSAGITDDALAMTYVGANNYCADTLLADTDWREGICNSEYIESVLDVKVPTMTSDTTPSGEAFSSGTYSGTSAYAAWYAFNGYHGPSGSSQYGSDRWAGTYKQNTGYLGYKFTSPVRLHAFKIMSQGEPGTSNTPQAFTAKVEYYDGTNWQTAYEFSEQASQSRDYLTFNFANNISATDWRIYFSSPTTLYNGYYYNQVAVLQFYGREVAA